MHNYRYNLNHHLFSNDHTRKKMSSYEEEREVEKNDKFDDTLNNLTHFCWRPVKQNWHSPHESAIEKVKRSPMFRLLWGRRWLTISTTASWPRTLETRKEREKNSQSTSFSQTNHLGVGSIRWPVIVCTSLIQIEAKRTLN